MILIGFTNGILREFLLLEPLGDELAYQVSTITLFIFLGFYIWYIVPKVGIQSIRDSWITGVLWFLLTVLFEFGLGLVTGQTVTEHLAAYNIIGGNLWIIIPLWVGIAPRIFFTQIQLDLSSKRGKQ